MSNHKNDRIIQNTTKQTRIKSTRQKIIKRGSSNQSSSPVVFPGKILLLNNQDFETQVFLSLIESKQITGDRIDVAKTDQEAIKLMEQSFVKAGKIAPEDPENEAVLVGNENLYALILLKDEIDTTSNDFKVAS